MASTRTWRMQRTAWGAMLATGLTLSCAVPALWAAGIIHPTGTISIHTGSGYTKSPIVTLHLAGAGGRGGVSRMRFSNDGRIYSSPEPYASTKAWILPGGQGLRRVYVKFGDRAGRWSLPASASIILDTITPIVDITYPTKGMLLGAAK